MRLIRSILFHLRGGRKIRQSTPVAEVVKIYGPDLSDVKAQLCPLEKAGFTIQMPANFDSDHCEWRAIVIKEVITFPG
jgi:hypothetical protein